jgi:hypothetical protein
MKSVVIPLSRAIIRERVKWLGYVLQKEDRLLKIALFVLLFYASKKNGSLRLGWDDVVRKDLSKMGTSWEGVKREALNRLGGRRSVCRCISLRWLGAEVICL